MKILLITVVLILLILVFFIIYFSESNKPVVITSNEEDKIYLVDLSDLFHVFVYENDSMITPDGQKSYRRAFFELIPQNSEIYHNIGLINQSQNTVVVFPIFTITAYGEPGFYNYFNGKCDTSCLTDIPIRYDLPQKYQTSDAATKVFQLLGYQFITDIEIDKNPDILKQYDKVILLHNEYVTQAEFDAITKHPKVIYLYPNALYAEITINYELSTITLVKGHNYPEPEIINGFDWEFENTIFEKDSLCKNWKFYENNNGLMLNCYPENIIFKNKTLLKMIKEY